MTNAVSTLAARVYRTATLGLGLALMVSALASTAHADIPSAPEIDPGSLSSAMTLLVGGTLTLTGRIRRSR